LFPVVTRVPSSISNSDIYATTRNTAPGNWIGPLVAAAVLLAMIIVFMEARLAAQGFHPSMIDSNVVWAAQRERASALGERALIIVGASRSQTDLDLDTLRRRTGLEPVLLALDWGSIAPVLKGLADDPRITGTVLIDVRANDIASPTLQGQSAVFEASWEQSRQRWLPDFNLVEDKLSNMWRRSLRSYADGANPISSLLSRVLQPHPVGQYMRTSPMRERLADYQQVTMPNFYLLRVAQRVQDESGVDLTQGPPVPASVLEAQIRQEIERMPVADTRAFAANTKAIADMIGNLRRHGAKVMLVEMPTSGLESDLTEKRYPRALFWDRFVEQTGVPGIRSADIPQLRQFTCPDGSHLDYRDRERFTNALADVLWSTH
jgi:hypothetical protein